MKPITPDAILFGIAVRQRIQPRLWLQGLVKAGIEHRDLRHTWKQVSSGLYAAQIGVVMQRSQGGDLADLCHHTLIDDHRLLKEVAAMSDPVTD